MPTDPIATSVWGREARRRSEAAAEPTLSRAQIVAAAIALLDAEGPGGLSMRRLGAALGSGTTSVYWYVANKDELLDLALDEVMAEVTTPDVTDGAWRNAMADYARGLRTAMVRHSWVTTVMGVRPNVGPNWTHLSDWLLEVLTDAGFTVSDAGFAGSAISAYAMGAALADAAYYQFRRQTSLTGEEIMAAMAEYFAAADATYPHLYEWISENRERDVDQLREDTFEFGLQRHLDGLEAWSARR